MLVLTRKSNQSIMIGDDVEVSVLSIMGEKVRIGIQAPRNIPVFRHEVYLEIQQENAAARASARAEVDDALKKLSGSAPPRSMKSISSASRSAGRSSPRSKSASPRYSARG
jgi:carbon storage regulator